MQRSYLLTLTLLMLHQIDAAYWREWEMFLLPGGVQFFVVLNALLVPGLIWGQARLAVGEGLVYARVCALLGLAVGVIHGGFFAAGYAQFQLPVSIGLIVGCTLSGAWLLWQSRAANEDEL